MQTQTTQSVQTGKLRKCQEHNTEALNTIFSKSSEECEQYISQKIDEIKILTRKKKIAGDLREYNTCHSCNNLIENSLLICCTQPECSRYFCFRCLNLKFDKTAKTIYEIVISSTWDCMSCQNACNCRKCKGRSIAKRELFPSELALSEKNRRKQATISCKVEVRVENPLETAKAQHSQAHCPSQTNNLILPAPIFQLELIPEIASSTQAPPSPLSVPSLHSSKPRSRDLAKLFGKKPRSDANETAFSVGEDEEEQSLPESPENQMEIEENKSEQATCRNYNTRGSRSSVQQKCHICDNMVNKGNVATCSVQNCQKHYCIDCIRKFHQKNFDLRWNYNPSYFMCFSCDGVCECQKCNKKKDTGKKKSKNVQESSVKKQKDSEELLVKRRVKYYDTLSDEEEDQRQRYHEQRKQIKVQSQEEIIGKAVQVQTVENQAEGLEGVKACTDASNNRYLMKKMKFRAAALLNAKIISQTSIDYACITLYDAETEDDIRK